MQISVIIPVFNAAKFLQKTVASVLIQPEVAEVILIDDKSSDDSLAIARSMAATDSRIIVLTHADGENKGSAETRNTGILKASHPFVAFIDADDIMLPQRFKRTKQIFEAHPDADGVYEAVKNEFTDTAQSFSRTVTFAGLPPMHMVRQNVAPEQLLKLLITDPVGIIMLQGLCVKRQLFEATGLFDPEFRVSEDMILIKKMAATGRLYAGDLNEPVAARLIHDSNITFSEYKDVNPNSFLEGKILFEWGMKKHLPNDKLNLLLLLYYTHFLYRQQKDFTDNAARFAFIKLVAASYPSAVRLQQFWSMMPVFGRFIKSAA